MSGSTTVKLWRKQMSGGVATARADFAGTSFKPTAPRWMLLLPDEAKPRPFVAALIS